LAKRGVQPSQRAQLFAGFGNACANAGSLFTASADRVSHVVNELPRLP